MGLIVSWKSLNFVGFCVLKSAEPRRGAPKERYLEKIEESYSEDTSKINPRLAPLRRAGPRDLGGVTWLADQHGCALSRAGWWVLRPARSRPFAAAALAARRSGWGRRGQYGRGRGRGFPRGLLRLWHSPAARGPWQLGGRAPILAGSERPRPGSGRAAARAHQGALPIP